MPFRPFPNNSRLGEPLASLPPLPISMPCTTRGHTMKSNTLKLAIAALIGLAIIGGDMLVSL